MPRKNTRLLRENGPMPLSELPHKPTVMDRAEGVTTFKFNVRGRGGTTSPKNTATIAYLFEEHDREAVARCWCENNRDFLADRSLTDVQAAVGSSLGSAWTDPFRAALEDRGVEGDTRYEGGANVPDRSTYEAATEWSE